MFLAGRLQRKESGLPSGWQATMVQTQTYRGQLSLAAESDLELSGDTAAAGFASPTTIRSEGSLEGTNVQTVENAQDTLRRVDSALNRISEMRATMGATQNRFESAVANLSTTAENLAASRSRVRDADFASETAELTRAQILQQAGVAMVSQANSQPQGILALLQ